MYLCHYYLQKGIAPEYLLSLSPLERLFYRASMELYSEELTEALDRK